MCACGEGAGGGGGASLAGGGGSRGASPSPDLAPLRAPVGPPSALAARAQADRARARGEGRGRRGEAGTARLSAYGRTDVCALVSACGAPRPGCAGGCGASLRRRPLRRRRAVIFGRCRRGGAASVPPFFFFFLIPPAVPVHCERRSGRGGGLLSRLRRCLGRAGASCVPLGSRGPRGSPHSPDIEKRRFPEVTPLAVFGVWSSAAVGQRWVQTRWCVCIPNTMGTAIARAVIFIFTES